MLNMWNIEKRIEKLFVHTSYIGMVMSTIRGANFLWWAFEQVPVI